MIEVVDDQCDFCGCCVGLCPVDSIELREAEILILEETCIDCELCVYICPVEALTHVEEPAEV
ncbi:MAG: indolepyruvate ferredoxin oxidoreductase subunit alpha [Fidelibacterota bacterium]